MKFCVECGKEIARMESFCTNCGTKTGINSHHDQPDIENHQKKSPQQPVGNQTNTDGQPQQNGQQISSVSQTNRKPMSKTTKVLLIAVTAIIAIGFGTHKWLQSHFDPMNELEAMDNAIIDDDIDTFLSYITFDDNVGLDEQSYFDYIKDDIWESGVKHQYQDIIEESKENNQALNSSIETIDGFTLYNVKQDKKYGLYPSFSLQANPIKLQAYSDLDNTNVNLNGKDFDVSNKEETTEIGAVYPGTYDISATVDGDFGEINYQETLHITQIDDEVYLDFLYEYIYINSSFDYGDAIVYVDGKKTDYNLEEDVSIGPFPGESTVQIHAEWKDGHDDIVTSNMEEIDLMNDDSNVYFDFDETKTVAASINEDKDIVDQAKDAGKFILSFREAYENAVNYTDYAEVEPYIKKDSHADKELKKFIKDMDDGYYSYDFEEDQIIKVKDEGDHQFTVQTNEKFRFIDDDGETYKYDRKKSYEVEDDDGKFLIKKIKYDDTKKDKVN